MPSHNKGLEGLHPVFWILSQEPTWIEDICVAEVIFLSIGGVLVVGNVSLVARQLERKQGDRLSDGQEAPTPPGTHLPQIVSPPSGVTRGTPMATGGSKRKPSRNTASSC